MRWWQVRSNEWQLGEEPHRPRGGVEHARGRWRCWASHGGPLDPGGPFDDPDETMQAVEGALRQAGMRGLVEPVPRFVGTRDASGWRVWHPAALVQR